MLITLRHICLNKNQRGFHDEDTAQQERSGVSWDPLKVFSPCQLSGRRVWLRPIGILRSLCQEGVSLVWSAAPCSAHSCSLMFLSSEDTPNTQTPPFTSTLPSLSPSLIPADVITQRTTSGALLGSYNFKKFTFDYFNQSFHVLNPHHSNPDSSAAYWACLLAAIDCHWHLLATCLMERLNYFFWISQHYTVDDVFFFCCYLQQKQIAATAHSITSVCSLFSSCLLTKLLSVQYGKNWTFYDKIFLAIKQSKT